jgi:hypothetical protein
MACRAGANVTLQDCLIFNNITSNPGGGIYIDSSQVTVYGSQICENSGSNTGAGIYAKNNSILLIDCSNIQGNYIDVIGESYGGGLYVWDTHLEISYSTITENSLESMMPYTAGLYCTGSRATMVKNCTISRNTLMGEEAFFAAVYGHSDTLIFENTIIEGHWGTENCFYISPTSDSVSIRYCDFYNNDPGNFTGSLPQGLGILRSINANGDSCDIYFNIYLDPLFYSIAGDSAYYLSANSPCIDAGDPASPLDPDSTIADIGAFYYNQYIPSIQTLTITISDNDIILQWGDVPEAEIYYIYRSTEPYFEVTGLNPIGSGTEPGFTDVNALTEDHYYYRVTYEY